MFSVAFASVLSQLAIPGLTIIISAAAGKWLESQDHPGMALMVTGSSMGLLFFLWILPMLDQMSSALMNSFGLGSGVVSLHSSHYHGTPIMGSWGNMSANIGALHSEINGWASSAWQMGQTLVDVITK